MSKEFEAKLRAKEVCACMRAHVCVHVCMCTCVVCVRTYFYPSLSVLLYLLCVCVYKCICTYVCMYVRMYVLCLCTGNVCSYV